MDIIRSEKLDHAKKYLMPWHQHAAGQLYWLNRGMIALETPDQQWALTADCIGWFPPHTAHRACAFGHMTGLGRPERAYAKPAFSRPNGDQFRSLASASPPAALDGITGERRRRWQRRRGLRL